MSAALSVGRGVQPAGRHDSGRADTRLGQSAEAGDAAEADQAAARLGRCGAGVQCRRRPQRGGHDQHAVPVQQVVHVVPDGHL